MSKSISKISPDAIPVPTFEGRVEYKNVGFDEEDSKVLEHISLTVEPGQTVAFVGPSGVGKTTSELIASPL